MKNLLITGSSGFIGKNLLKYIADNELSGYRVILLSSVDNDDFLTIKHNNYSFTKQDFFDRGIGTISLVIHLGAFTPKVGSDANNIGKSNENIINTKILLDNLPNVPDKFIFASTVDAYGKVLSKVAEEHPTDPLTLYGWSKLYCEKMVAHWCNDNAVVFQILRIGHIYGRGEEGYKKVIPVTIDKLRNNVNPQIFGQGTEKRSFLHVDDVCHFIMKSLCLEQYEGIINLCSSHACTIKEVVEILLDIADNKNLQIEYVEMANKSVDFEFDTQKMNKLLGYEKVELKQGLEIEYRQ
jgi:nucleoside-diphosphate-sugar epimerase